MIPIDRSLSSGKSIGRQHFQRIEPAPEATTISKAEAIRRMLAEGIDNPSAGSHEIKEGFGIELTPQHFSATKTQMKSKGDSAKPKGRPGRPL